MTKSPRPLADIQSQAPHVPLAIAKVGIRGLQTLLTFPGSAFRNPVPASADLAVSLDAGHRGTHMSRLAECLQNWQKELTAPSIAGLLKSLRASLAANSACAGFQFTLFINKCAPATGLAGCMGVPCFLQAETGASGFTVTSTIKVPVMTVCPCSLAICETGAHSQRALISLTTSGAVMPDLENLIDLAEKSGSAPVRTLLKREDEKKIIEQAFAAPAFVEDVARKAAVLLMQIRGLTAWRVEVESMESIHSHNAYAVINSADPAGQDNDPAI